MGRPAVEFRRAGWQRQVEARRLVVRRRHDVEQKSSSRPYPEITSNTYQMMCGSLRAKQARSSSPSRRKEKRRDPGRRLTVCTSRPYRRASALHGCDGMQYVKLRLLAARAPLPLMQSARDVVQLRIVRIAGRVRPAQTMCTASFVYNCTSTTRLDPARSSS